MKLADVLAITEVNTRVAVNTGTSFITFVAHDEEDALIENQIIAEYGDAKVMNIWYSVAYNGVVFNV